MLPNHLRSTCIVPDATIGTPKRPTLNAEEFCEGRWAFMEKCKPAYERGEGASKGLDQDIGLFLGVGVGVVFRMEWVILQPGSAPSS